MKEFFKKFFVLSFSLWFLSFPVLNIYAQAENETNPNTDELVENIKNKVSQESEKIILEAKKQAEQKKQEALEQAEKAEEYALKQKETAERKKEEILDEVEKIVNDVLNKTENTKEDSSSGQETQNSSTSTNALSDYTTDGPASSSTEIIDANISQNNSNNENTNALNGLPEEDIQEFSNTNVDPVETQSGDVKVSGDVKIENNDGSAKIKTGEVDMTGDVVNKANTNTVSVNQNHHTSTDIENRNINTVTNLFDFLGSSGRNEIKGSDGSSQIDTGNVDIKLNLLNLTNTNLSNSEWGQYFFNSKKPLFDDINLKEAWHQAKHNDCNFGECAGEFKVVNLNESYVTNKVKVIGISGQNKIQDVDGDGIIRTGDVRVATNLINFLNTNLTGSDWNLAVVNVFDGWQGDLILPGKRSYDDNRKNYSLFPNTIINNSNDILIDNNISLDAGSGENTIDKNDGSADIQTGDAFTRSNTQNIVNANFTGGDWYLIIINRFGNWDGNIYGKPDEIGMEIKDNAIIFSSFLSNEILQDLKDVLDDDSVLDVSNQNLGELRNEVLIQALTGENQIIGNDGDAKIITGKATIFANILNIANVNITGGDWYLGIINVFGDWKGDIYFGNPDLKVSLETNKTSLKQGEILELKASYENSGNTDAENVKLILNYDNKLLEPYDENSNNNGKLEIYLGDLKMGKSGEITKKFKVLKNLNISDEVKTTLTAQILSDARDIVFDDNSYKLEILIIPVKIERSNDDENNNINESDNIDSTNPQNSKSTNSSNSSSGGYSGAVSFIPIKIEKTNDAKGIVLPGKRVSYTITIKNISYDSVYGIEVLDTMKDEQGNILSQDSWEFDELKARKGKQITYDIILSPSLKTGNYINYAEVKGFDKNGRSFKAEAQSIIFVKSEFEENSSNIKTQSQVQDTTPQDTTPTVEENFEQQLNTNTENNKNLNIDESKEDDNSRIVFIKETFKNYLSSIINPSKKVLADSYFDTNTQNVNSYNSLPEVASFTPINATFTPIILKNDDFYEKNTSGIFGLIFKAIDTLSKNYIKFLVIVFAIFYISSFLNFDNKKYILKILKTNIEIFKKTIIKIFYILEKRFSGYIFLIIILVFVLSATSYSYVKTKDFSVKATISPALELSLGKINFGNISSSESSFQEIEIKLSDPFIASEEPKALYYLIKKANSAKDKDSKEFCQQVSNFPDIKNHKNFSEEQWQEFINSSYFDRCNLSLCPFIDIIKSEEDKNSIISRPIEVSNEDTDFLDAFVENGIKNKDPKDLLDQEKLNDFNDYGSEGFSYPFTGNNIFEFLPAKGYLEKNKDESDKWKIILNAPCFTKEKDCNAKFKESFDKIPIELKGLNWGCELWVEVYNIVK